MSAIHPKKLFLLDGIALVYRAHFALIRSPSMTSKGMNTSAALGYTNTLVDIIRSQKPTHLAVAFDTPEPTARHKVLKEYKAHREAMPEELSAALPYVDRITEGFNIPILRYPGYEADDVIGTLARQAAAQGIETYMVTPDKDFAQLVDEHVFIYKPGRMGSSIDILGIPEVLAKWEVERIDQVCDVLGLQGDPSDNIPGIPGIGEKTAKKLIKQFDSVENLIANTDQLKGKQKENVENFADQGLLSKQLVTIDCNVPVEVTLDELVIRDPDAEALSTLFRELEFQALGKRVLGKAFQDTPQTAAEMAVGGGEMDLFQFAEHEAANDQAEPETPVLKTIADVEHDYRIAQTPEERAKLAATLAQKKTFAFDLETSALDPRRAALVGIAVSHEAHTGWYIPVPPDTGQANEILKDFLPLFADSAIALIGHNLKFDLTVLRQYDITVKARIIDTMLAHALIEPEMRHKLDFLAEAYLGYRPVAITELAAESMSAEIQMRDIPVEKVAEYAAEDADVAWQLWQLLEPLLEKKNALRTCHDVESPLVSVLIDMELTGITVDTATLRSYSVELEREATALAETIFDAAGKSFNLDSPKQLGHILFDVLQLEDNPKKTATGQYATNEQVLSRLAYRHPIVADVLTYRTIAKLKSTYVDMLPDAVDAGTGRIHTHFHQAVTVTGRLQSERPNLQNIPIKTAKGREIRKAFVACDDGHVLLSADYSQIELRVIAEISGDEALRQAFVDGADIHRSTAARVYGVGMDGVTPEMRGKAKMVNFGIPYGITAFGLAQRLNCPRGEANELIEEYFRQYPLVQAYMTKTIEFARQNGFVETLLGRRRYLRDINSRNTTIRNAAERNAINMPIQGTAADMIKIAMINLHGELAGSDGSARMLLQVHDELVLEVPRKEVETVGAIVRRCMCEALPMEVPIVVDMGTGSNWLDAH